MKHLVVGNLPEAARAAVVENSSLIEAQAAVCDIRHKLCPIPSYVEVLREVYHQWNNTQPVAWPSPLRHEVTDLMNQYGESVTSGS